MGSSKPESSRQSTRGQKPINGNLDVRKLGLKRLRRFCSLFTRTMQTDKPKIIHDFRVASRRLQQILDDLYPLPRSPQILLIRSRIRHSRRALSKVRDYDVFIAAIEKHPIFKIRNNQTILATVLRRLHKRRAKLLKKASTKLDKVDVPELCANLNRMFSNDEQSHNKKGHSQSQQWPHPRHSKNNLHKLWQDFANEVSISCRGTQPTNLHRVRIMAKRLRYSLEVMEDLGFSGVVTHLKWLHRLQQYLGDWHDFEVQEMILLKMRSRRSESIRPNWDEFLIEVIREMQTEKTNIEKRYIKLIRSNDELRQLRQWIKQPAR